MPREVHEPEAELLSAGDAIRDAEQLQALFRQTEPATQSVSLRVPVRILLDALDDLEPEMLRQVVRRAEERLAEVAHE